jgi:hypothetical protein
MLVFIFDSLTDGGAVLYSISSDKLPLNVFVPPAFDPILIVVDAVFDVEPELTKVAFEVFDTLFILTAASLITYLTKEKYSVGFVVIFTVVSKLAVVSASSLLAAVLCLLPAELPILNLAAPLPLTVAINKFCTAVGTAVYLTTEK